MSADEGAGSRQDALSVSEEAMAAEIAIERDREIRAAVILDVAMRRPHRYSRQGIELGAMAALQSQPLVTDLVKLGLFSMNIEKIIALDEREDGEAVSFSRIPSFLLGVGVHYAIEVAPTLKSPEGSPPVISVGGLENHVRRIEKHFGIIPVDSALVARVAILARDHLQMASERDLRMQPEVTR